MTLTSVSAKSQNYLCSEVIDKAGFYLKSAVGEELFKYFKIDPHSYYEYQTKSGKKKWGNINKGKRTKGIFLNGEYIRFILDHPEFPYQYIDKRVSVELNSELKLASEINLEKIPQFLLNGEPSNWISDTLLDTVIARQNLKAAIGKPIRRLKFDNNKKEYYWVVFNTLYEEKCFSDEEIIHIEPESGKVLKHYEERQYLMHCY